MFLRARREKKEKDEMNECANAKQLKPQYVPLFVPFLFPAIVSSTKCTDLFFPGNAHTFLAWTISDTWDWKGIQTLYHWQKWHWAKTVTEVVIFLSYQRQNLRFFFKVKFALCFLFYPFVHTMFFHITVNLCVSISNSYPLISAFRTRQFL